ncbi:hypothetical protein DPMN_145634 [Dreissena polymorpha]|uniref:Uncharacterized protein n=1 Tax=Dreissena polymorpha TaxID=45954 RepID=A0A9D4F5A4_DREPO|nr:hypothetical protein DPMN_145634 [Dreissena polymorpha]
MMIAMLNGQLVTVAVHYRLATHNSSDENGKPDPASPLFKCNGNDLFHERQVDFG